LGVDQIRVRIGNTGVFTVQDDLNVPDRACEGNCSRQFDLFVPGFQVGGLVSPLGELYVTIEGNAEVDLCGKGHFLMAVLGLEWTPASGTAHSAVVVATWKGGAGQLDVSVPEGFYAVGSVVVWFVLRNPLDAHPGSYASIQVVTPQGSIYGPAPATGSLVMQASRQAAVSVASMIESTRIQGALNMLQLELAFNGQIVASDAGVWITIRGLFNSSTPSSHGLACLKLGACTDCEPAGVSSSAAPPPQSAAVDLAALITLPDRGCANWDQEVGELTFHLRAPSPTTSSTTPNYAPWCRFEIAWRHCLVPCLWLVSGEASSPVLRVCSRNPLDPSVCLPRGSRRMCCEGISITTNPSRMHIRGFSSSLRRCMA